MEDIPKTVKTINMKNLKQILGLLESQGIYEVTFQAHQFNEGSRYYNFIDDNTLEISFTLVDDMSIKTNCVLHANTKRPKYIINSNNT
jgi:hypothetical protein